MVFDGNQKLRLRISDDSPMTRERRQSPCITVIDRDRNWGLGTRNCDAEYADGFAWRRRDVRKSTSRSADLFTANSFVTYRSIAEGCVARPAGLPSLTRPSIPLSAPTPVFRVTCGSREAPTLAVRARDSMPDSRFVRDARYLPGFATTRWRAA